MDKLTEIRKAYIERLAKVIEVNPGFRVDAVTVQIDVQYLLQLVETQAEELNKSEMTMRKAVAIWETADAESDFENVMQAVIDLLKVYLIQA